MRSMPKALLLRHHRAGAARLAPAVRQSARPDGRGRAAPSSSGEGTPNLTVNQSTDKAIINWNTFDIGNGETTTFVQPSANSVTLNRVTGGLGCLGHRRRAQGQRQRLPDQPRWHPVRAAVRRRRAGLVATTNDIKNDDFMAGRYVFDQPGKADASVVNAGTHHRRRQRLRGAGGARRPQRRHHHRRGSATSASPPATASRSTSTATSC